MKAIRICAIIMVSLVASVIAGMNDGPNSNNDNNNNLTPTATKTTTIDLTKRNGLQADSELGMKLLSYARRVEEANADGDEQQQQQQQPVDFSWVAHFSLKFQGCHHVQQVS
jgi:hypothetical protein